MVTRDLSIASRTTPGLAYRLTVAPDGEAVCTCPGWSRWGHCVHADMVKGEAMTTALEVMRIQPPTSILPTRDELSVIADIARSVIGARGQAVPASVDTPAKALAIMLAGHELGVKPMSSLRHITVIGGRTEPDAQLCAGIVIAREPDASFEIIELTAEKCTMRLSRPSRNVRVEYTYELKDADRAGLVKPGSNWQKFPKDMLRAAATKRLCRLAAPDLINAVGAVELTPMAGLLAEAEPVPANLIDLDALPAGALYNEGDPPERVDGVVVDPETGEVLEEAAGEPDAPPVDEEEPEGVVSMVLEGGALSRDVWTWVAELLDSIATKHFEGDWEQVYGAFGGHPEAAPFFQRTRSRRPHITPMGRTNDEAHALGALLQGWLNTRQSPTAPRRAPEAARAKNAQTEPAPKEPTPPRAREPQDERLGAFRNVGEFYVRAGKELGLKADRVREIAGVPANSLPNLIVTYEGEAGAGLDALWLACATVAAGVEVGAE